jgi:hypothetical protein
MQASSFLDVMSVLSVAPLAFVAVDAALGQHPEKSLDGLRGEVKRWRDEHYQEFTDADCEKLTAWLNRNFYRLQS